MSIKTGLLTIFSLSYLAGIFSRTLSKEYILTGGTASLLSTTTTYSLLVSSLCCCLLFCTCCDSDTSIGEQPSITPHPLYLGWKQASIHPHYLSTSKHCTAASAYDLYSVFCPLRLICLVCERLNKTKLYHDLQKLTNVLPKEIKYFLMFWYWVLWLNFENGTRMHFSYDLAAWFWMLYSGSCFLIAIT